MTLDISPRDSVWETPDLPSLKVEPLLGPESLRRVLIGLIAEFQGRLISRGALPSDLAIDRLVQEQKLERRSAGNTHIQFDEATLGLDSLALLDLVMEVTRYFDLKQSGVEDYLFVQRSLDDWVKIVSHHYDLVGKNAQLAFSTSGSTGPSKIVVKSAIALREEIGAFAKLPVLNMRLAGRVLSAVAPHHIYGMLWGVLYPGSIGRDVLDLYKTPLTSLGRLSREGDIVLGTPFIWERCATYGAQFAPGCSGVTSGGPTSADTWEAARTLGLSHFLDIYGSTETGGIGFRTKEGAPYQLFTHLTVKDGAIYRRSDQTMLPLQDRLEWTDATRFHVVGRLDSVVQVAGTNVNTSEVEKMLGDLDCVQAVAVRFDGTRLKAFVVPASSDGGTCKDAVHASLRKIPAAARPSQISYGAQLPRSEIGKLVDW